jgi:hypothetical protein
MSGLVTSKNGLLQLNNLGEDELYDGFKIVVKNK